MCTVLAMQPAKTTLPAIAELIATRFAADNGCAKWSDEVKDIYGAGDVDVYCEFKLGGAAEVMLSFDDISEEFTICNIDGVDWEDGPYEVGEVSEELVEAAKDWAERALEDERSNERGHMACEEMMESMRGPI